MTHQHFATSVQNLQAPLSAGEEKRNRKTQLLSALLSASALGVFLEGCGGGGDDFFGDDSNSRGSGNIGGSYDATLPANTLSFAGKEDEGVYINIDYTVDNLPSDYQYGDGIERYRYASFSEDSVTGVYHIIGSRFDDRLYGDRRANHFEGGGGDDTDIVIDDDYQITNKIVFEQGANDAYEGATYNFAYVKSILTLTVREGGETLNTIGIAYPKITSGIVDGVQVNQFSDYKFYTRKDGSETEILTEALSLPTLRGERAIRIWRPPMPKPFMALDTLIG